LVYYWKVYPKNSNLYLDAAFKKINQHCLEYFQCLDNYDWMKRYDSIWIFNAKGYWLEWNWLEGDQIPNQPSEDFKYKYMGEINVTDKDIEEYKFYLDAKRYNL
jgi:hypothetical protein